MAALLEIVHKVYAMRLIIQEPLYRRQCAGHKNEFTLTGLLDCEPDELLYIEGIVCKGCVCGQRMAFVQGNQVKLVPKTGLTV